MEIDAGRFIVGVCLQAMQQLPQESVDFVLTSPPYADQRNYGEGSGKIPPDSYVEWFRPIAEEIYRVLNPCSYFA